MPPVLVKIMFIAFKYITENKNASSSKWGWDVLIILNLAS